VYQPAGDNAEGPFPAKLATAYGYRNVYELTPLIDMRNTQLQFVGR
jgi:hypothetical protein